MGCLEEVADYLAGEDLAAAEDHLLCLGAVGMKLWVNWLFRCDDARLIGENKQRHSKLSI